MMKDIPVHFCLKAAILGAFTAILSSYEILFSQALVFAGLAFFLFCLNQSREAECASEKIDALQRNANDNAHEMTDIRKMTGKQLRHFFVKT